MPIDYKLYPKNWKTEIRPAILRRARNRCEFCGVPDRMHGSRNDNGEFMPALPSEIDDGYDHAGRKVILIVLTVAHLNHNINDNEPENLAALCQKCHFNHDERQHISSRYRNKIKHMPDLLQEDLTHAG